MYDDNKLRTGAQSLERTLAPGNVSLLTVAPHFPFTANGSITGSAAVANGTAYFGTMNGHLYALNVTTASITYPSHTSWIANTTSIPMANCSGWPAGIMSTPAIWGKYAIVGTGDAVGKHGYGWVQAYNLTGRAPGVAEWATNLSNYSGGSWAGAYVWSSPVIYDGNVYIGLSSGGDCPLVQGALFELNATTGHVVHQANMTVPGTIGASVWSSPAIDVANGTIWVTTGNNQPNTNEPLSSAIVEMYLSNLTVKAHWQVPGIAGLDDDFGAGTTLVAGTHGAPLAIATNKDDVTYAVNRSNLAGGAVWEDGVGGPPAQGSVTPAAAGGGLVYLAGGPVLSYSYTGLPSGCTSINTPDLVCRPSGASNGVYTVQIRATDGLGHTGFANTSITVAPAGSFEIVQFFTNAPYGTPVNSPVQLTTQVMNASGGVTYAYARLPPGCSSSNSAVLSCTPNRAGAYRVEVWANETRVGGTSATAILTLGVLPQSGGVEVLGSFNQEPTVSNNQSTVLWVAMSALSVAGSIQAVYPGNGTLRWVHASAGFFYAGPTYANGMVIDAAIWGNYSGTTIEVLNAANGNLLATYNVSGMVDGEPVVADGRIYFGTAPPTFTGNGKFYALDIPLRAQATAILIVPGPAHRWGYGNTFNGSAIGGSPPYSCHWVFGSIGTSNSCGSIPITFSLAGSYLVTFTVTDAVGTVSTYSFNFTYYVGGVCKPGHPCPLWLGAGTTVSSPCSPGSPVYCPIPRTLSFATYVQNGTAPYTYQWNFGDEGESGANFPVHTYSADGEYLVTLTVTDHEGLQGSLQFEVLVT